MSAHIICKRRSHHLAVFCGEFCGVVFAHLRTLLPHSQQPTAFSADAAQPFSPLPFLQGFQDQNGFPPKSPIGIVAARRACASRIALNGSGGGFRDFFLIVGRLESGEITVCDANSPGLQRGASNPSGKRLFKKS